MTTAPLFAGVGGHHSEAQPNKRARFRISDQDKRVKRPFLVIANRAGVPDGHRRCTRCKSVKPLDLNEFPPKGKYWGSWCRVCCREVALANIARARRDRPEAVMAAKRKHAVSAKGRETKRRSAFIHNNARRQRRISSPFYWRQEHWLYCLATWNDRCAYCDGAGRLTQDHFVPLSAQDCPGTVPANMLPACPRCNSSKRDRDPAVWIKDGNRLAQIIAYLRDAGERFPIPDDSVDRGQWECAA